MREILADIQDGSFAREWILENMAGRPHFNALTRMGEEHMIEKVGAKLRGMMSWIGKDRKVDRRSTDLKGDTREYPQGRVPLHRHGVGRVGLFFLLGGAVLRVIGLVPVLFVTWFFRDPERTVPAGEGLVVSPADGKVIEVYETTEDRVGPGTKVAVFMSVFNVHVNRIPVSGTVLDVIYKPGAFKVASLGKKTEANERMVIYIQTESGVIRVDQVAGLIARRIGVLAQARTAGRAGGALRPHPVRIAPGGMGPHWIQGRLRARRYGAGRPEHHRTEDIMRPLKRRHDTHPDDKQKKSVPFLPNFITTMSLFCGFYSIMFSLKGDFHWAAILILVSGFIDGLDGRVARMTGTTSEFGKQYDSLSDVIAFGVAPAVMVYLWQLNAFGKLGFIATFLFVACGALRLARFNIDTSGSLTHFTGLPIPVAAAGVVSTYLFTAELTRMMGRCRS